MPGSFGVPAVTEVQVDGSTVAFTDNSSGNAISVDLNTKVTASSKLTILFTADAPTTQDLTGVDFTSTVDDSGTGDAAQSTTEGNGDGDAGDNDSWNVTTTDAAGTLVAHWTFDEGSGQTAADSSGNGNDGTLGSTAGVDADDPTWECVAGGYALNFDGTDDIVNAGSAATLDDLGPMTIAAWIKPDSAGATAVSHVMSKSNTGSGRWFLEIDNSSPEDDAFEFNKDFDTDVARTTNNATATYDVWQHIAVTWDGSATGANIHIYKDGVESSYASTINGSGTQYSDAALPFIIGNRGDGTIPFYGLIDDVRVYNSALSPAQISVLAASPPADCDIKLLKRAFWTDSTPIPTGATIPSGVELKYLLYVNNPGAALSDVTVRDVLDPAFLYQAGTIQVDNSVAECVLAVCTTAEELAIFTAVDGAPFLSDAVDGDAASYTGASLSVDAGNGNVGNLQLDINADAVWAILFSVKMP